MGVDADSASLNPIAPESHPEMPPLPEWFVFPGWFALLGTVISALLPGAESIYNISSGLGLLFLIIYALPFRKAKLVSKSVFITFTLFSLIALLSAIIPNYSVLPDYEPMSDSFHDLWNTIQAAVVAALCIILIRRRSDLTLFLLLFTLVILCITLVSPVVAFFKNGLLMRLTGTKGGANRYAIMLLVSSLPIWTLTLSDELKKLKISFSFSSVIVKVGYHIICWLALIGIYFNLYLSGSRMTLLLAILVLLSIGIWKFRKRWLHCLVAAVILLGIVSGGAYLRRGEDLSMEKIKLDFRVRQFIWQGANEIFEEHPVLGCGYGTESFYRNWSLQPPENEDFVEFNLIFNHAHNLWRHLLATQGILGFIAFHGLWLAVVLQLSKSVKLKKLPTETENSASYATLFNTPVIFVPLLGMLLLQLNGILTLPLQGCNEILYWLVGALGLAGLNISADNK